MPSMTVMVMVMEMEMVMMIVVMGDGGGDDGPSHDLTWGSAWSPCLGLLVRGLLPSRAHCGA